MWFIVHRKELLDQAIRTFKDLPNVDCIMINSYLKCQSEPDIIIIDEAHHSTSKTYINLIHKYNMCVIIGLTATPTRLNGKPLGDIYNVMINEITAKELIKQQYLSDYDYYAPTLNIDFNKSKIIAGDYNTSDIDFLMNKSKVYGDIINTYIKMAHNKKTIVYCTSIKYSLKIEKLFQEHGFVAKQFDGTTPKTERDVIVDDFKNNKIQILINVDLIGEGFDVPDCDCVVLLRPTQSLTLFIQQSTRCLRPNKDKRALILDFVGNVYRHGMPTETIDWSLKKQRICSNKKGEPEIIVRQCGSCYKCYQGTNRICPYCQHDNGKTRREIAQDKKIELLKIESIEKLNKKREQGMADSFEALVELGKQRNYKNPAFWARQIMRSRGSR